MRTPYIDALDAWKLAQQIDKEMEERWQDCTVNGECSNCGGCCGNMLPLSEQEIKTIKKYMKHHPINEQTHRYPTASIMIDDSCPFRSDTEKKCLIYEVRPAICRDYRCDKPKQGIKANRDMYQGKYGVCNMRLEFFGGAK